MNQKFTNQSQIAFANIREVNPSLISDLNRMHKVIEYFKEAKSELKKVTWPTRQQALNHTLLVIGISLGMAAFLGILDYLFTLGFEYIIGR